MIDLTRLFVGNVSSISLDGTYIIPKSLYEKSEILDLSEIKVNGHISTVDEEYTIIANVSGIMTINDSISFNEVKYPFNIDISEKLDDFLEKNEKSLDIIDFLWQNIVLEVPLRYTETKDYSNYLGDNWKLVSEDELTNNPFKTLLNNEDGSD